MTALALVLAVAACAPVQEGWDSLFGSDEAPAVAAPADDAPAEGEAAGAAQPEAPIPEGLRGEPSPPDYLPGMRREPTSPRALNANEQAPARQPVFQAVSPAAAPAPAPAPAAAVAPAPAPAPVAQPAKAEGTPAAPTPMAAPAPAAAPAAEPLFAAAPVSSARPVPPAQEVERAEVPPPPVAASAPAPAPAPEVAEVPPAASSVTPLVPATPAREDRADTPRTAQPRAAESSAAPRLRPPPAVPAPGPDRLLLNAPGGQADLRIGAPLGGGIDDLGTTVIGGDGRVLSGPGERLAHPDLTPDSYGFDVLPPAGPVMLGGQETLVATIQFGHGSASLSESERRLLRQVVTLQRQNGGTLQVVGHASSRTADMSMDRHRMVNYVTSVRRAEAVARELRRLGAPDEAVQVVAQSDNQPIYREVMPSGEAGNRRAEVYLVN